MRQKARSQVNTTEGGTRRVMQKMRTVAVSGISLTMQIKTRKNCHEMPESGSGRWINSVATTQKSQVSFPGLSSLEGAKCTLVYEKGCCFVIFCVHARVYVAGGLLMLKKGKITCKNCSSTHPLPLHSVSAQFLVFIDSPLC